MLLSLFGLLASAEPAGVSIVEDHLAVSMDIPGQSFSQLAMEGRSRFYIAGHDERIYLEGEPERQDADGLIRLTYTTSD